MEVPKVEIGGIHRSIQAGEAMENKISTTLTADDQQAVMEAINLIRSRLPFLIDISLEERRTLPKMGDRSRSFVDKALEVAVQNEGILPRSFEVEEMNRDVALFESLYPIMLSLNQLQELVEDTCLVVGSEAYSAALVVYASAKQFGKGAGLDAAVDELGKRFARKLSGSKPVSGETGSG